MMSRMRKHNHKEWSDWSIGAKVAAVFGGIVVGAGLIILFGFVTMSLWNWIMPRIFGLPLIGYWEAWGILLLSCILFGRLGGRGGHSERGRKRRLRERIRELEEEGECEDKAEAEVEAKAEPKPRAPRRKTAE
jgi:hypothetical protein